MGYCGTRTIEELRTKSRFIQVTGASVLEGHPHDIVITQEAPNYSSFSNENDSGAAPVDPGRTLRGPGRSRRHGGPIRKIGRPAVWLLGEPSRAERRPRRVASPRIASDGMNFRPIEGIRSVSDRRPGGGRSAQPARRRGVRRPILAPALTATVLGIALSAPMLPAQQVPPESPPPIYPMIGARGASHVLRTGWDYIQYEEYERALNFLREAEKRQSELSDAERQSLKQGIERAQRGMREAVGGSNRSYAISGSRRAGAIALAPSPRDPKAPATAPAVPPEPIQLTSGASSARAKGEPPCRPSRPTARSPPAPAARPPSPAPALPEVARAEPAPLPAPDPPPARRLPSRRPSWMRRNCRRSRARPARRPGPPRPCPTWRLGPRSGRISPTRGPRRRPPDPRRPSRSRAPRPRRSRPCPTWPPPPRSSPLRPRAADSLPVPAPRPGPGPGGPSCRRCPRKHPRVRPRRPMRGPCRRCPRPRPRSGPDGPEPSRAHGHGPAPPARRVFARARTRDFEPAGPARPPGSSHDALSRAATRGRSDRADSRMRRT